MGTKLVEQLLQCMLSDAIVLAIAVLGERCPLNSRRVLLLTTPLRPVVSFDSFRFAGGESVEERGELAVVVVIQAPGPSKIRDQMNNPTTSNDGRTITEWKVTATWWCGFGCAWQSARRRSARLQHRLALVAARAARAKPWN